MAKTIRQRVLEAVKAALDGSTLPQIGSEAREPSIHRSRSRPIEDDQLPAAAIYPSEDDISEDSMDSYGHGFRLAVELRVQTPDEEAEPTDDLLEEMIAWVVPVVMEDPSLGGVIHRLRYVRVVWDQGLARDEDYGACQVIFEADFSTPDDDPTTLS